MKKVLLAERHAITRDGIRYILQETGEYQVARELSDGDALIATVKMKHSTLRSSTSLV
jgi:DNA-binding NarL/FixJ family response regulator